MTGATHFLLSSEAGGAKKHTRIPKRIETNTFLRTGNFTIHYTEAGAGYPLVLLHGLAGSRRWWLKNISVLGRYFKVYVLEMAGFGRSRGQRFSLKEAPGLVQGWMDAMKIEQCHVMGHSMGGCVAAALVRRNPERFGRVVLVDAVGIPIRRTVAVMAVRLVRALYYMPVDFFPVLVGDIITAGPVTLSRAIHDILQADMRAELEKIQADTMVVWGEYDRLLPVQMGVEMQRRLPRARLVVVQGAGHNPMWDRPSVFHEAVIPFLQQGTPRE